MSPHPKDPIEAPTLSHAPSPGRRTAPRRESSQSCWLSRRAIGVQGSWSRKADRAPPSLRPAGIPPPPRVAEVPPAIRGWPGCPQSKQKRFREKENPEVSERAQRRGQLWDFGLHLPEPTFPPQSKTTVTQPTSVKSHSAFRNEGCIPDSGGEATPAQRHSPLGALNNLAFSSSPDYCHGEA